MNTFIARHPVWALIILILVGVLFYLIFAVWPPELEQLLGRKRVFLNALLNGITLGGLYFMVASGFTLIFGLMRNVNLAHGSLYLLGGYVGYEIARLTGAWVFSLIVAFVRHCLGRPRPAIHHLPSDGRSGPATDAGHHRDLDHPRRHHAVGLGRGFLPGPDARLAGRAGATAAGHRACARAASSSICSIRWCGS